MSAAVAAEQRHTRVHPCLVCGGFDGMRRGNGERCAGFVSEDGEWEHCMREELAVGLDQEAGGTYAHRMHGPCNCGTTHGGAVDRQTERDEIEALYDYRDEKGALLFQVMRKAGKRFLQRKPDGAGGWDWKIGDTRRVLYRLPDLLADDGDRPVFIAEGEKDVDRLWAHGQVATCGPMGAEAAGRKAWRESVAEHARSVLVGRDVVVIADNDKPGREFARIVAAHLQGGVRSVRVVRCPDAKDVSDHFSAGGTLDQLVPLVDDVPACTRDDAALTGDAPPAANCNSDQRTIPPMGTWASVRVLDGEAIAAPLPPVEYLVQEIGLVAGGGAPHLLAGYGFSGKTVAAQSLALSLASARPVWGSYASRDPLRVLHVDLEQGDRVTRHRYQRLALAMGVDLASLGDALALAVMPPLQLTAEHAGLWRDAMTGRDLVIVDSLRAASPGQDENSSDIRAGLDMLGRLSEETRCRPLVIHHARKTGKDDPGGRFAIRGSSAIFDGVDSAYLFSAEKGEPVAIENVKARTHGELADDFALVISDTEIDGEPKAGLRVHVHGAQVVAERRERKADEARDGRVRRDAETVRRAIAATPGINSTALRGVTLFGGDRMAAALAHLGEAVVLRNEKVGRGLTVRHYLRGAA